MKVHIRETLKRNFEFIMFVSIFVMFIVAIVFNIKSISKSGSPTIIAIDANGTRVVTSEQDPIYKTEALKFLQKFLVSVYNFDSLSFVKQIGYATNVMSDELWEKRKNEILELQERVERDHISLSGKIQKLTVDENGNYFALINVTEQSRLSKKEHLIRAKVTLKIKNRTADNPAGLVVDTYEEDIVNN